MSQPVFFTRHGPFSVGEIAAWTGAELRGDAAPDRQIADIAPLETAGPSDLVFIDNPQYAKELEHTRAGACLTSSRYQARVPGGTALLLTREPYRAFATVAAKFYAGAIGPVPVHGEPGIAPGAHVHPLAGIEEGATVEPGASVGARVQIGKGTIVASGAVIGHSVTIGRDCYIGANATVLCACVGNRVLIHPGVNIGQDGFGFAMGAQGHLKVPQVGRVIIQDDVEIGASTTVDRGGMRDTIIGEGTKIDNHVQIGHNVVIGRHCVIVSLTGISGSAELGDFVVLGGKVGVIGHLKIGSGAQIAASSNVITDVPPGVRWGGTPARPMREWFREVTATKKLAQQYLRGKGGALDEE